MATIISSGEALRLLSNWKEDGSLISVWSSGEVSFSIKAGVVADVSEYLVKLRFPSGNLAFPVDEASFSFASIEEVPADVLRTSNTVLKACLKVVRHSSIFFLIETAVVQRPTSDLD